MRLIACVCATMDGQRASLNEGLFAGLVVTSVWTLVGMDAIMSL